MASNSASAPGQWLRDLRVVDFSTDIAGPYATKLMADAGADVIKVEPADGDPMRRWSATGADLGGEDGGLFRFLHHGKRSVVGRLEDPEVASLLACADLVVESFAPGVIDALDLPGRHPGLVLLSISPRGRGGPEDSLPATEFTIQAECGSIGTRGLPGQEPFQAGGRTVEWLAGPYAAVGALAAVLRAQKTGHGEHVDFSLLEVTTIGGTNYTDLFWRILDSGPAEGPLPQTCETPSIEPTSDGYVGFCTNSRQQFSDFLLMIGRHDLQEDEVLAQVAGRMMRMQEWSEIVHAWTRTQTTAEVIEQASLLRIPVAPINNGDTVRHHEQIAERGVYREDPTGTFLCPRPPYRVSEQDPPPFRPAPKLGEHTGRIEARTPTRPVASGKAKLPLEGVRIVDMTAWWAGPSACQMLAFLGAEVIHVESIQRPDGMRMIGGMFAGRFDAWWEASHFYVAANTNKKGVTLDLTTERGQQLIRELLKQSDAVLENFTPRVMENFGLTWESLHAENPRLIMLRMPAFGLSGPWRDNTGFAQTMEQMSGLAWLTGHRDDQPRIQRGPCDPLAGMHAAFSFLVALAERERTGVGSHVECTMVEGALNAAAEQLIEFTAYGNLMERNGNRCPESAPQGLYPCLGSEPGTERWLALSVHDDAHWEALKGVLGRPAWADAPELSSRAGRRAQHDRIDAELRPFFAEREREKLVSELRAAGVPAAPLADPRRASGNAQMAARGFFEEFDHPLVGRQPSPTAPFRYASVDRWLRGAAPTLGQHNHEILGGLLGLSEAEIEALEAEGVIGTTLAGA
jgi:crotonobetainyl-CoA:carnitine CoA-transferase CaiB-like acyl-CoA transferase